jgi:hypothetical protein
VKNYKLILLLAVALCPAAAQCQSADADNLGEAVGMMQATLLTTRIMKDECSKRFPEMAPELDEILSQWQIKEARAILKSNISWAEMVKKDARAATLLPKAEAAVRNELSAAAAMPGEAATQTFSNRCRQHFSDLASGVFRTRTPNAYKYLDSAP